MNIRKIGAVVSSVLLTGMSAGFAAAASFPNDFTSATPAIVYGANAALDLTPATSISNYLSDKVPTVSGDYTDCATSGSCYLFELASTKLNVNDTLRSIKASDIDDAEIPDVLAELDYVSGDSKTYGYTQKITMYGSSTAGLRFTSFKDETNDRDVPAIGIKVKDGGAILNYTVSWKKQPKSDVDSAGRLEDIEDSTINLLGKEYTILNVWNASENSGQIKMELMGGAVISSVNRDETVTHTLEGSTYAIRPLYISDTKTKLCVSINGGAEEKCGTELQKGETVELTDGVQLGVRAINYAAKSGTVDSIDFSLGAEKLTLQDAQTVEINDEDVTGMTVNISYDTVSSSEDIKLSTIRFDWEADDDLFITESTTVEMPALKGIKLVSGGYHTPAKEDIEVKDSGNKIELRIPIKSGTATIPLLKGNDTTWNYIGSDDDDLLVTGNISSLGDATPDITYNKSHNDRYFVASWNSSTDSISYFLTLKGWSQSDGINYTDVYDEVTSKALCEDVTNTDTCTLGNLVMTFSNVDKTDKSAVITLNDGGTFNKVYSAEGALFYLPVSSNDTRGAGESQINLTIKGYGGVFPNAASNVTTWNLPMIEEDKDGALGKGQQLNFSLGWTSNDPEVKDIDARWADNGFDETNMYETDPNGDSEIYVNWVESDLGTKVTNPRPSDGQNTVEIEYYGDETYGKIYLSGSAYGVTGTAGNMIFTDAEETSWKNKNIIIVGGSCVNTAAAKALGVADSTCGADFTTATGVGESKYLIQSVAGGADKVVASGKIALVVAGYEAADTVAAASRLVNKPDTIDSSAGNKYVGTVSTTGDSTIAKVA